MRWRSGTHLFGANMEIGQAVFEALVSKDAKILEVIADWIEDYKSLHPEAGVYLERLRTPRIRVRTIIDVVCKFGCRRERKLFARVNRIMMEFRHKPDNVKKLDEVTDLFSMAGRRQINRLTEVSYSDRSRKKPILAAIRKRSAIGNELWFMQAFVSLLSKYYGS